MVGDLSIVNTVLRGITFLREVGIENRRLHGEIKDGLDSLWREVDMAEWDVTKHEGDAGDHLTLLMQELLFDIQDFLCDLSIRKRPAGFFLSLLGMDSRREDISRIESFKTSIKSIQTRLLLPPSSGSMQGQGSSVTLVSSSAPGSPPCYAPEKDLVGIAKPKQEIVELLSSPALGPPRVISIMGCSGVGKTALARAVYESDAVNAFHCKAWVVASSCNGGADELLRKVLQGVDPTASPDGDTSGSSRNFLQDKRYLVIIDDVQKEGVVKWEDIKNAFPGIENGSENEKGSRIIVTTGVQSIARVCSSGSYYVYPMQCLSQDHSKDLFWNKVYGRKHSDLNPSSEYVRRSERILGKCGNLPLALNTAASYLQDRGKKTDLSEERCEDLCATLRTYMQQSGWVTFDEQKRSFVRCYDSVPLYVDKNCLLYLSIFPCGHEISSKRLARRLIAEEVVVTMDESPIQNKMVAVRRWLEEMTDRSMVEPVMIRNNPAKGPKRCQLHGAMLEFAIQKSLSKNLVTLIDKGNGRHGKHGRVRRLTIQSSTKLQCDVFLQKVECRHLQKQSKLSSVRSLTIFDSGMFLDFKSCKMMRVLDLEGCTIGLDETVLDGICELVYLRYLSLRKTGVKELPRDLHKLMCLETLDIRDTPVAILLPLVVIMLPELAYLLGKFELPPSTTTETRKLKEFLRNKSKLLTLAGIVIQERAEVLETILEHARMLMKVKIWTKDTPPGDIPSSSTAAADSNSSPINHGAVDSNIPDPATIARTRASDAPDAPGNSTSLATSRKIKSLSRHLESFRVFRKTTPNLAASNGNALCTELQRNPSGSPHQQPNASSLVPPASSGNSVRTSRLPGILASSHKLHSLSIESDVFGKSYLASMKPICAISSIKLRGGLGGLPALDTLLKELRNLNKLHLSLSGLNIKQLASLQNISHLEYLKLAEDRDGYWEDSFVVEGFLCLKELCFEGPKHPRVLIQHGAMKNLTSLKLLCKESPQRADRAATECDLGVEGLSHLAELDEVILHHSATDEKMEAWKKEAVKHRNLPHVKRANGNSTE